MVLFPGWEQVVDTWEGALKLHSTWLLTFKLLRHRFGPIWGSSRRFSSATWPGAGGGEDSSAPSFRPDFEAHLGP